MHIKFTNVYLKYVLKQVLTNLGVENIDLINAFTLLSH